MPYVPQLWKNGDPTTPVSAKRLNNMETGIYNASLAAEGSVTSAVLSGDTLNFLTASGVVVSSANVRGPKGDSGDQAPASSGTRSAALVVTSALLPSTRTFILGATIDVSFSTPTPSSSTSGTLTLIFKQPSTGGPFSLTWPSTLPWLNGAPAPVMPTASNSELLVHLFWTGVNWRGVNGGVFYP